MNQSVTQTRASRIKTLLRNTWNILRDIHRPPFYFVLAGILTFLVECLSRRSPADAVRFVIESPLAFLTNYSIILLTVLLSLLFRKRVAGLALMTSVWTVLGIAQCIILLTRVSPLSAVDIAIALSVISIIGAYLSVWQIVLICLALVGLITGLIILFIRAKRHPVAIKRFAIVYGSSVLTAALVIASGFATGQLSDKFPNLAKAYNDYGFPYCFSMSVVDKGVDRPSDYGEELMTGILDDLPEESTGDSNESGAAHDAPNVIMVQLESFFDVNYLRDVTFSSNPVPHFTSLKAQYPSGLFNISVIGAGTVNTEFEVLTGMNVTDFGAGEYPFRSIMLETTCETIAYDLLDSGYRTHAIHNHEGSFYLRHDVYKNMGFESFTSIEYFQDPTFNENDWAHDALLTDEILYLLQSTEEADFVFAVSVQGHGKYPNEYTPKDTDILITGGIEDDTVLSHYQYYINQLKEMDAFIGELYDAVMAMEEDTVLVLYGDHLPSIARDEGIVLETGEFQTEYIIISNYETPTEVTDGELYAYELFPAVMEMIGNTTGVMTRFHTVYRDDPEFSTLLAALEYDVLYGRRMAYNGIAYPVMDMVMGSRTIEITDVEIDGEFLYVYGNNFTAYSVVTWDKREQETEFLNSTTLRVHLDDYMASLDEFFEYAETVSVRQISDTAVVLSETKPFSLSSDPE